LTKVIELINNRPSFFFDAPGCDTWILPDPSVINSLPISDIINFLS
jgi:hypothetical protein